MSTPNGPYGYDPSVPPPSYPAQGYQGAQGYPGYPAPPVQVEDPDSAMGIVGLVLSVISCGPIGLVVSWIALNKSKARGFKNTPALIGAIVGGIFTIMAFLPFLAVLVYFAFLAALFGSTSPDYLMLFF